METDRHNSQQEIFIEDLEGKQVLGWRWHEPKRLWSNVVAYPELACGNKPWDSPTSFFDGLPFHPGERKVTVDYNIRLRATGTYNMAFSMWAVSALPATPGAIRCEVMIWIQNNGQRPSGTSRGNVNIKDQPYDLFVNEHQHDVSGTNTNEWTYVAFVPHAPMLKGTLELSAFLEALQNRKILTEKMWITNVEVGDEVTDGSGVAEIQDFALRIEKAG